MNQEQARELVVHRTMGLAYLEESKLSEAEAEFQQIIQLAPKEPLGYADLGLTYLRMGDFQRAEAQLKQALDIVPNDPHIRRLLARVYEMTNQENAAIKELSQTLKKRPDNVRTLYYLAQFYEQANDPQSIERAGDLLGRVVAALPGNLAARLQYIEMLIRSGQTDQALKQMEAVRQIIPALPAGSMEIYERALEFIRKNQPEQAFTPARIFHNLLKSTDFYQAAIVQLRGTGGPLTGAPIEHFQTDISAVLTTKEGVPATLRFTDVTTQAGLDTVPSLGRDSGILTGRAALAHCDYDGDGDEDVYFSRATTAGEPSECYLFDNEAGQFTNRVGEAGILHGGQDVAAIFADYNNDGYSDLFIVNSTANHLYENNGKGGFVDVTARAGVGEYRQGTKPLFADFDLDGDLDLFIAGKGTNRLFRNNGDGTFLDLSEKSGLGVNSATSVDAGFGDFDDDGDLDLFVVNADGSNKLYTSLREGYFKDITKEAGLATSGGSAAVAIGDYDNDGYLDFMIMSQEQGKITFYRNQQNGKYKQASQSPEFAQTSQAGKGNGIACFDYDNDGYLDLFALRTFDNQDPAQYGLTLFHNDGTGRFARDARAVPTTTGGGLRLTQTDFDNDGDEDCFVVASDGRLHLLRNDGGNVNNYLDVRLAGLRTGSGKNNFFGIGAKVEVKAGALYAMRVMTDPIAHFGLGTHDRADVMRVVWSNGVPQNRFDPEKNQTIVEHQTLKGSCPWLYAWNGQEYDFVTDVLWSSALGMPLGINAGETQYVHAFSNSTDEYLKVPGNKLQPKKGRYSLQFTDELWESPYVDRVQLLTVDHPDSVDVYIDEHFTPPPFPPLKIYTVVHKRFPLSARDDQGQDVLSAIREKDGRYISDLTPDRYQGVMRSHDLTLDLGPVPSDEPVHLFLYGWVFPTDASINTSIAQSDAIQTVGPLLQVKDVQGHWRTVIESLGFPKGKNKTVIVDLTDKFLSDDHHIRIRTNLEIYWDQIFFTVGEPAVPVRTTRLNPVSADLHYRGFSKVSRATPYSPHIPDYSQVTTSPKWRDLTGYYTRYGDVSDLLLESDSKYVIMNAGDEITIEFAANDAPEIPSGWTRDFLFYNDGWLKDGDLNTATGQTVKPLPFHGMTQYPYGPDESYPQDAEHQDYLRKYNTRRVDTEDFRRMVFRYEASGK